MMVVYDAGVLLILSPSHPVRFSFVGYPFYEAGLFKPLPVGRKSTLAHRAPPATSKNSNMTAGAMRALTNRVKEKREQKV